MLSFLTAYGIPVLALGLLARSLWVFTALGATWRYTRDATRARPARPTAGSPRLLILLPMLREQSVAARALTAFAHLPYGDGQAAICVITTEREEAEKEQRRAELAATAPETLTEEILAPFFPRARRAEAVTEILRCPPAERLARALHLYDREPTTADLVEATIRSLKADRPDGTRPLPVVHLHQPPVPGHVSSQLNFALSRFEEIAACAGWDDVDEDDVYVTTYDADSTPDRRSLAAVASVVDRYRRAGDRPPGLIQQQRLPLVLGRPFPAGVRGALLAADWVYQTRRCLAIELTRVLLHHWSHTTRLPRPVRGLTRPLVYAVGCGMTARLSTLRAIGGYQHPFADIGSGTRISMLGENIASLGLFAVDETYTDLRSVVNLQSLAYASTRRPGQHAKAMAERSRLRPWERALLVARGRVDLTVWILSGPVTAAGLAAALVTASPWLPLYVLAVLLWGPVTAAAVLGMRSALWRSLDGRDRVEDEHKRASATATAAAVVLSPLAQLIETSGPWRVHALTLFGRKVTAGKTER
ncbi:hypothetical protein [Streptomyces chartreusis]|uniref:hypothetical protein n=1 Tax=Streptomyces chartreusis TaxID=1969 RepID=UPI0033A23E13